MTSYTDHYLRADDEAAMIAALPWARTVNEEGTAIWQIVGSNYVLDCIGLMVATAGVYDADGNEITPPVMDIGFHLNLRTWGDFAETIPEEITINPSSPSRKFS